MSDDTRDIAVEARTDIRAIKKLLEDHIHESREHRDDVRVQLQNHNNLIEQMKGARLAVTAIVSGVTAIGLGTIAKVSGLIR
jgi:hypothetical protein